MTELSEIEAFVLLEISEAEVTLPDLLFAIRASFDNPAYKIHDFYRFVNDTIESLISQGLIQMMQARYSINGHTHTQVSATPVPYTAIPTILREPHNWDRTRVIQAIEKYTFWTTPAGEAYLDSASQNQ